MERDGEDNRQGIFNTRNIAKKFGGDLIFNDDGKGHLVALLTWEND